MRERFPLPNGLFDPNPKDIGSTKLDSPKFRVSYQEPPTDAEMSDAPTAELSAGKDLSLIAPHSFYVFRSRSHKHERVLPRLFLNGVRQDLSNC